MSLPLLFELRNVSLRRQTESDDHEEVKIFDNLNLSIAQGESVAIIGANGSGKSSLLALLQSQLKPMYCPNSYVRILGKEHVNIWDLKKQIGVISPALQQSYRPSVRGEEILLSGYYGSIGIWEHQHYTQQQRQQVHHIAEKLHIQSLLERYYYQLSTGEQRRFLLGRALIHNPHTLIFDEPSTGLDIKARQQYLHLLEQLASEGKSIILVTHHLEEVIPQIQRVILLSKCPLAKCKIIGDAAPDDIINSQYLSQVYGVPVTVYKTKNQHYRTEVEN